MDPIDNADENAIAGDGSASDMAAILGPGYADAQDPMTTADNGTINNAGSTGSAPGPSSGTVAASPSNGASYTPPSWFSSLLSSGGSLATTVTGIVNGKPAVSPAQAGATLKPGASTITLGGQTFSLTTILLIAGAALVGILLLRRK